ncbi:MAG: hypothetical protein HFACDABA_00569 [Anaerolineales bacterium]|nr:hypothetical protein [Anaerolineales bacterium]
MIRNLMFLIAALALAACGPARFEETQAPQPTASADWTSIKFTQSGGIMGLLRVIEISRDGGWTFADERAQTSARGKLSAAELDQLDELIVSLSMTASDSFGVCADCFTYSVEIFSPGSSFAAEAIDINLDESGLGPLVDFLTSLMSKASAQ